ncbi:MAG: carbohydrate ABC transporter permease [Chloroflexota bacterium]
MATTIRPTAAPAPAVDAQGKTPVVARRRWRLRSRPVLTTLLAYGLAVVFAIPIFWMVSQSLTPEGEIYVWPLRLFPAHPTLENYHDVLFSRPDLPLGRWYVNSFFVAFAATGLVLLVASLAAYAYARLEFPGRTLLFFGLLSTMMIPGAVTLIPVFLILRDLGLIGTYWALILPHGTNVFAVFLLRQFFQSIPRDLEEAAVLDGCSRLGIYWHVILPLSRSALAALAIFVFLGSWNDFLWPFIAINDLEMRTLPVGLTIFNGEYWSERGLVMAGAALSSIPVLIVYAFFQHHIIRGVALTGLKA